MDSIRAACDRRHKILQRSRQRKPRYVLAPTAFRGRSTINIGRDNLARLPNLLATNSLTLTSCEVLYFASDSFVLPTREKRNPSKKQAGRIVVICLLANRA